MADVIETGQFKLKTYGQRIKLNLETILDTLEEIFGQTIIASRCITRLVIDDATFKDEKTGEIKPLNTLGVTKNGTMLVSRPFWEEMIHTKEDLKTVLLHELMHHITGDVYEMAKLDPKSPFFGIDKDCMNIAMDARINAFIDKFMPEVDSEPFLDRMYNDNESPRARLLHPCDELIDDKMSEGLKLIYDFLYHSVYHKDLITYRDIYHILLREIDPDTITWVPVLGNHNVDWSEYDIGPPKELEQAMKDLVKEKTAGHSDVLKDMILDEMQGTGQRLNTNVFKKLGFDHLFRNIRSDIKRYEEKSSKSAIPHTLSRADLFRVSMGWTPFFWDFKTKIPIPEEICAPIYLDVSGSMIDHLPVICDLITNVASGISHVWGFSNEVYKHSMEDLKTPGGIKSTWGTDFDCVITHAREMKFKHIVLITDGYAWTKEKIEDVKTHIKQAIVIMTEDGTRDNFFSNNYNETYSIAEVTV